MGLPDGYIADTLDFNSLNAEKAEIALETSRKFVKHLAMKQGVPNDRLDAFLHAWCGCPINKAGIRTC